MGAILGKSMDDNLKKQQEFMMKQSQLQMERQLQMQNAMRQRQMAAQIARGRDLFMWWGSFYTVAFLGGIAGVQRLRSPAPLFPLLPLTFIVSYLYDLGYGSKLERIKAEADRIMDNEHSMLALPHGLPSFEDIESARVAQKDQQVSRRGHDLFL